MYKIQKSGNLDIYVTKTYNVPKAVPETPSCVIIDIINEGECILLNVMF